MLTLPIKKKWFDMIKDGIKKEEYRKIKPYWTSRFKKYLNKDGVKMQLRNGYSNNSPSIECMVSINIGCGNPDWGAIPGNVYYILKILSVEEVKDENTND